MTTLQAAFDRQIDALPRRMLEALINRKLAELGIEDEQAARQAAETFLIERSGHISIPHELDVTIEVSADDVDRLKKAFAGLLEDMPAFIESISGKEANRIVEHFQRQWLEWSRGTEARDQTRARVSADWGGPLDALAMLVTLCKQEGDSFNTDYLQSRHQRHDLRTELLARLHIRACRIADEILLLLEHGHAEGAQARWRTLHEVAVVATLIAEGGEALAKRYVDHEIVERKKALADHRRAVANDGGGNDRVPEATEIRKIFDKAIRKYGRAFHGMYGWASEQLGLPKEPQFHHLQEVAGSLTLKLRYRLASFGVHASPTSLSQPVHRWDPTMHVPGVFAPGFEAPAGDTAQSIVQITILLYPEPWDLDRLALIKALSQLRDETADSWFATAARLERDERRRIERAIRGRPARRFGYVKARPGRRRK